MPSIIKITDLVELTSLADGDYHVVVDVSEPLDADKTKKITSANALSSKVTKPSNPSTSSYLQQSVAGSISLRAIKQTVQIQIVDAVTEVNLDVAYFFIPAAMDGMNLVRATAMVLTAGTTNPTTIQVRNLTKYPSNDALSTAISIASAGTIATAGTVSTSYDDVSTNDKIRITVTAQSTVKPLGLFVVLEYQLP